jgi:UDP:flavonoid glycosyltransferase YjiC (YdhE family)
MSHILIAAHPSPGHVNPLIRIAKYLSGQRHDVTLLTASVFEEKLFGTDIKFVPLSGDANHDYRDRTQSFAGLVGQEYPLQLNEYLKYFSHQIQDEYADLQKIIGKQPVDLIIADLMFFGVLPLLLQRSVKRPPLITIGVCAPLLPIRECSPFSGYDASPEGLRRNEADQCRYYELLSDGRKRVDVELAKLGLSLPGGFGWESLYVLPDAFLQLSTEEFDLPTKDLPPNFRFVGPLPPEGDNFSAILPAWLEKFDGARPVVFASQGSVANLDQRQLLGPTIEALEEEDIELLITQGGRSFELRVNSPRIHVEGYLPYDSILPKADVFLTNGGFNGVQQALTCGVPVIMAGNTEEKPLVGYRLCRSGAGLDLGTSNPSKEQIRKAVFEVLGDRSFKRRAQDLQRSFVGYDALHEIAEVGDALISARLLEVGRIH